MQNINWTKHRKVKISDKGGEYYRNYDKTGQ